MGTPFKVELSVDGQMWDGLRHGVGVMFRRRSPEPNLVVDVHVDIENPNRLDAWRLQQYVESIGGELTFTEAEAALRNGMEAGVLIALGDGGYESQKGVGETMADVKYPEMRTELIQHLQALSDVEYQQRVWVLGESDGATEHDEFDYAVHYIYDDTRLATDPASTIGTILRSDEEAGTVSKLVDAIDMIFQKYGTKLSDAEYIQLPEWDAVLKAAKEAASLIQ